MTAYASGRWRHALVGGAGALAVLLAGCSGGAPDSDAPSAGSSSGASDDSSPTSAPAPTEGSSDPSASQEEPPPDQTTEAPEALELPRGGTEIFPDYRLFGYSGLPGSPGMGRMGIGDLDERVEEMEERGEEYAGDRELLPVLELIATVVHASPGSDGMYRTYIPEQVIQDHLDAARRHDGILLLNIQPGRSDFIDEVEHYEKWLVEPDVGVALDPEWAVEEGQVPGEVYGRTTGEELDEVAEYLADLVEEHGLPEKVMVYHQVHAGVVRDEGDLEAHDGVVEIKSVDGIGAPSDKISTYDRVMEGTPEQVVAGFKLFYEEDAVLGPIMTGEEVLSLEPQPEYILFE
ncbi:hypothetical protein NF556_20155 [Ornithinimicrobium faecis]|uniref:Lipoprotein n=1 Tax=Ornithinimicrobium faecis TaxID=2934158 RepID=A0ABY4YT20_9MICO|nr:hypothetical protein [Ornithinimicrobium sp. HY1793]USQ79868.1 hypothetical protein NF556_20155 [Ornithinimicrobium sp. HY1793]